MKRLLILLLPLSALNSANAQDHSIARVWNELLLESIRLDNARPTVHARNLFHISAAMYDVWATYEEQGSTYFLGQNVDGFNIPFDGIPTPENKQLAIEEAMSFAVYRLIIHRFNSSPGSGQIFDMATEYMNSRRYNTTNFSTDYSDGDPANFGNYLADRIIEFGLQDGSNEILNYQNTFYFPINEPLDPTLPGNPDLEFYNRWQPLAFDEFVDQSGNPSPVAPQFLSPEWGLVSPFALDPRDLSILSRDGLDFWVFHDPGEPPQFAFSGNAEVGHYRWGFELVSVWSGHLDPSDGVMWDISPATIGNIQEYPTTLAGLRSFYNRRDGGDTSIGHAINPVTGLPYEPQIVPRGDYGRVLAEFWADGPDSETPPGHWFTILNYVNDHPMLEKRFEGAGEILDDLEWDVKSYFILGGAVHDAAISAWSIKGYYDYVRPISAIRGLAQNGQSSDMSQPNFNSTGIGLVDDYIESVEKGDPLAGEGNVNVGKVKLKAWKGPEYIEEPDTDVAGVDWILAENWWPYQRPNFVTPPFAGYVSGHSTFSRAAAEVLTFMTGDPFFPGGIGEFEAPKNEFLVFEDGPSVDLTLQWATYRDASDQCSLSRIWGGIHPPVDDMPGRLIGEQVGLDAFDRAKEYFAGLVTSVKSDLTNNIQHVYPNPAKAGGTITLEFEIPLEVDVELIDAIGRSVAITRLNRSELVLPKDLKPGVYVLKSEKLTLRIVVQ